MDLNRLLSVPYAMEAETVLVGDAWIRRLSYPELPGCEVEGTDIYRLVDQLEQQRVELLRAYAGTDELPGALREPLAEGPYCLAEASLAALLAGSEKES